MFVHQMFRIAQSESHCLLCLQGGFCSCRYQFRFILWYRRQYVQHHFIGLWEITEYNFHIILQKIWQEGNISGQPVQFGNDQCRFRFSAKTQCFFEFRSVFFSPWFNFNIFSNRSFVTKIFLYNFPLCFKSQSWKSLFLCAYPKISYILVVHWFWFLIVLTVVPPTRRSSNLWNRLHYYIKKILWVFEFSYALLSHRIPVITDSVISGKCYSLIIPYSSEILFS